MPYIRDVPRRSNSVDDDSESSGGTESELTYSALLRLGTQEMYHRYRPQPLKQPAHSNLSTNPRYNPASDSEDWEKVPLPSRKKMNCSWSIKRVLSERNKSSAAGVSHLGRSLSDSPCYLQARRVVNSAFSTRSQEDFPVSSPQSCVSDETPPLPPRDYPVRHVNEVDPPDLPPRLPSRKPKCEIHPIVKNGIKQSDTHYFLLEGKQPRSNLSNPPSNPEDYHNISTQHNDSTTLWTDAPAARLNFGAPGTPGGAVGARGASAAEGLGRFLRTGIGLCIGQDRRLRRSQSDSERHLVSGSAESGLDFADWSSVDSAPCCVESRGYANHALDTSSETDEYSKRDLDIKNSPLLVDFENELINHESMLTNQRLIDGYSTNQNVDRTNPGSSLVSSGNSNCNKPVIGANKQLINSVGYNNNNNNNNNLNSLNSNQQYIQRNISQPSTNKSKLECFTNSDLNSNTVPLLADANVINRTCGGLVAARAVHRRTNHPRIHEIRGWDTVTEGDEPHVGWLLEDGIIHQGGKSRTDDINTFISCSP